LLDETGRNAEGRRHEYELSKRVSLVLHDPGALVALKSTGRCEVELPEELFDADYPGHFFRRLRSVAITIACVAGPYTRINCMLTLLSSKVRIRGDSAPQYREQPPDPRFRYNAVAAQSVATSTGQSDSGLFELNFADEGYLPFEGAGAISRWRIDLPNDTNAFEFETISDIVLKLSFNAREGGESLRKAARTSRPSRGRR
jgi:Tc toxin complex TcA C-terminal TcB-binding domain